MNQKVVIPKGLKKVECIKTVKMEFESKFPDKKWEDAKRYYKERFTLGKIYKCHIDKSGAAIVLKDDNGDYMRASYKRYFKPACIIKNKKSIKKRITNGLIKLLKKI